MLLFIGVGEETVIRSVLFKYISCYSLSRHFHICNSNIRHSNTSHVTLYQFPEILKVVVAWIQIHLMLLFIPAWMYYVKFEKNSNTSHVTLYHKRQDRVNIRNTHSNTSHVTLYRQQIRNINFP